MSRTIPPEIADAILRIEAQTFVRRVEWFEELGSTNDYALSIAGQLSLETPRLIWAHRQHAGRGRSGHAWWSAPGALTFSLLLDAETSGLIPSTWPIVSLLTGMAIAAALEEFRPNAAVGVKWPNDIWLGDRKVGGILMEPSPVNPARLVVGIGVNVANSFVEAPPELRSIATALSDHSPQHAMPVAVLLGILEHWDRVISEFLNDDWDLAALWRRRCVLTDRAVRVTTGDSLTEGVCRGIDTSGALLIETSKGLIRQVAGTVRLLSER
ncbi:MAG: biotin--[acetyl-CoA-carboxylase] ligase [Planctomycetales bacterium 12-60-4]|nr:MAG: biotin--[acetyl-CoA-carboxylase] ligase [Planctomycetales bacterium 12-60-4]